MDEASIRSHWIRWPLTSKKDRWYHTFQAYWNAGSRQRNIEITISPKGGNVRVYVDGQEWKPESVEEP